MSKIEDYLSEEEIKEICKEVLSQKIREDMRKLNVNDIIANISYAEVAAMVNTYVGEDDFCKREIPRKVRAGANDDALRVPRGCCDLAEEKGCAPA